MDTWLILLFNSIILFFLTLIVTRYMKKKSLSNITPFDLISYVVVAIILFLYFKSTQFALNKTQSTGIKVLVVFVFLQFILGVFTLLYHVPIALGLIHQIMAFFLLSAMTYTLHRLSK